MKASKQETIELCSVGFTYSIENVLKEKEKKKNCISTKS